MNKVLVRKLHPDAKLPIKGSVEAAAFDLCVLGYQADKLGWTVHTGLSVALPPGFGMLIYPRSGLATKYGLILQNGTGIIDSDYRGEILLKLNQGLPSRQKEILEVFTARGRVAQAIIIQIPDIEMEEVDELPSSDRGTGGFGSTGS